MSQRSAAFMQTFAALPVFVLATASIVAAQAAPTPAPPGLEAVAAKARLDGTVTAWCHGQVRARYPGAFAAAVTRPAGGGRYVVLDADATVTELGAFRRMPDLSCHTRDEAKDLDATIQQSGTFHGHIEPRWNTTVICGFLDETTAVCWQYSPSDRRFVQVGLWTT